jgi:hypothetical protein
MSKSTNLTLIGLISVALTLLVASVQGADTDPIPVPNQVMGISCAPSEAPVLGSDPNQAVPVGVGRVASGGDILRLHLGLNAFLGPVDLYFAIHMPDLDPANLYILTPNQTLQPHSEGIVPWKSNVSHSTDDTLFGDIPVSLLPASTYIFYLGATPSGQGFSGGFCLWSTVFENKQPVKIVIPNGDEVCNLTGDWNVRYHGGLGYKWTDSGSIALDGDWFIMTAPTSERVNKVRHPDIDLQFCETWPCSLTS